MLSDAAAEIGLETDAPEILLVDDDPRNLLATAAALDGIARVVSAPSGEAALRHLLARDFALILLDVQMPCMDGFETTLLIRRRLRSRHTPIIFLTAYSKDDQQILKAYTLGAVDFLFKPVVPELLCAKTSVFVALQRERARVAKQAALLRDHERREHARLLAEERRRWEERALRRQMEDERRNVDELARKTAALTQLFDELEGAHGELRRVNEELSQANERKDRFIAVLSHELRNPLSPLRHGLELMRSQLMDDVLDPAALRRIHASMRRQSETLYRLVDDLLDVSRIDRGQIELRKERLEINAALRQAIATVEPAIATRGQELVVTPLRGQAWIEADPVRVTQFLANVLANASRYTPDGGRIELLCALSEEMLRVVISDNGCGIAPELLPRIFDMFVQARGGGEGLGLGLTLARTLVEQHGGRIFAESAGLGRGSAFTIELPAKRLLEAEAPAESVATCEMHARIYRVVVVEDNPDVRESLRELLLLWGHEVHDAEDGETGLERILELRPDVAFVDIGMPKMDGYTVASRVREAAPASELRLVALTGFGQQGDHARTRAAGFDRHLVKPTSLQDLESIFLELAEWPSSRGAPNENDP
jgi:signal transduction histidine kinase